MYTYNESPTLWSSHFELDCHKDMGRLHLREEIMAQGTKMPSSPWGCQSYGSASIAGMQTLPIFPSVTHTCVPGLIFQTAVVGV